MTEAEISLIMRTLAENVKTYEQVVEVFISTDVTFLKFEPLLAATGILVATWRRADASGVWPLPSKGDRSRSDGRPVQPGSGLSCKCMTDSFVPCRLLSPFTGQVGVLFLQSLNQFQRYAYVRQAHVRERGLWNEPGAAT